ncbi:LapD/MoxY N-terminal periplasmic domain-containing protein [Microbulbifer marinus]|uniref:GGDEF domain-containing protein, diguanylate cyclase (C-di-GMP synthetase) or its enzymatically inactive variants n=1 Tax=Microbulbifer marinus TaxID=658218 RepID=A0A1H4AF20_9GAMM|nr:LapD/MoxY N-terminal periplasmic domain-containing protein [Microbulbifer marinus]SEA34172.1 GGDEF domain-containing protein, diguanylate cyclase (c-di-GMP synthetase) or its enzymatically inactive variants [Microbulbifer marinus]
MGLFQGIIARLLLVIGLLLGATLWLAIDTTRDYLQHQLRAYSQDGANALALALQPYIAEGDLLTADTMMTALVQDGNYSAVVLRDTGGDPMLQHRLGEIQARVPALFTEMLPLQPPEASAFIHNGWDRVASVSVSAHPALAYQQLWRLTLGFIGLGLAVSALAVALAWRWAKQKQQLLAAEFESLHSEIDTQRQQAQLDEQTGFGNLHALNRRLQSLLHTAGEQPAAAATDQYHLLLIHLSSLGDATRTLGRWAADDYVEAAAMALRRHFGEHLLELESAGSATEPGDCYPFHTYTDELALLGMFGGEEAVCEIAQQLSDAFNTQTAELHRHGFATIGIVPVDPARTLQEIIDDGDFALRRAESNGVNQWCYFADRSPNPRAVTALETSE